MVVFPLEGNNNEVKQHKFNKYRHSKQELYTQVVQGVNEAYFG